MSVRVRALPALRQHERHELFDLLNELIDGDHMAKLTDAEHVRAAHL